MAENKLFTGSFITSQSRHVYLTQFMLEEPQRFVGLSG